MCKRGEGENIIEKDVRKKRTESSEQKAANRKQRTESSEQKAANRKQRTEKMNRRRAETSSKRNERTNPRFKTRTAAFAEMPRMKNSKALARLFLQGELMRPFLMDEDIWLFIQTVKRKLKEDDKEVEKWLDNQLTIARTTLVNSSFVSIPPFHHIKKNYEYSNVRMEKGCENYCSTTCSDILRKKSSPLVMFSRAGSPIREETSSRVDIINLLTNRRRNKEGENENGYDTSNTRYGSNDIRNSPHSKGKSICEGGAMLEFGASMHRTGKGEVSTLERKEEEMNISILKKPTDSSVECGMISNNEFMTKGRSNSSTSMHGSSEQEEENIVAGMISKNIEGNNFFQNDMYVKDKKVLENASDKSTLCTSTFDRRKNDAMGTHGSSIIHIPSSKIESKDKSCTNDMKNRTDSETVIPFFSAHSNEKDDDYVSLPSWNEGQENFEDKLIEKEFVQCRTKNVKTIQRESEVGKMEKGTLLDIGYAQGEIDLRHKTGTEGNLTKGKSKVAQLVTSQSKDAGGKSNGCNSYPSGVVNSHMLFLQYGEGSVRVKGKDDGDDDDSDDGNCVPVVIPRMTVMIGRLINEDTDMKLKKIFSQCNNRMDVDAFENLIVVNFLKIGKYMSHTLFSRIEKINKDFITYDDIRNFFYNRFIDGTKDPSYIHDERYSKAVSRSKHGNVSLVGGLQNCSSKDESLEGSADVAIGITTCGKSDGMISQREQVEVPYRKCSIINFFNAIKGEESRDYLEFKDFDEYIREVLRRNKSLQFLLEHAEFLERYIESVIVRIYYQIDVNDTNKIYLNDLRKHDLAHIWCCLDDSIKVQHIKNYFSYSHFYVYYCTFCQTSSCKDMLIDDNDLYRFDNHSLNDFIVNRIWSRISMKLGGPNQKYMCLNDWIYFIMNYEDMTTNRSIEFWFKLIDLDADCVIRDHEIQVFFNIQMERLKSHYLDEPKFEDWLCQMNDAIQPCNEGNFTLSDFKKNKKYASKFFGCLVSLSKLLAWESRDVHKELQIETQFPCWTPWEIYCKTKYDELCYIENENCYDEIFDNYENFDNCENLDNCENFDNYENFNAKNYYSLDS
ncbi:phosphatase 2A regulatory subunit-related protein, putative [Plasmodium ovale wallikeri]|uniref:Phosphatase 2A regulatory subunit-related protein, putative n=1 Tax=Plasmodium ovale wallikeri TaxID=864142 RepID=A0A1A8Z2S2_PLAOA|nr:phosphatase 2A regulatory subunit-related protein, putative [Plasmodium ovale wallikeri]